MHFDFTINVTNVVALLVFIAGLITAHTQNIRRLQNIETRLDLMYQWFQKHVINKE